MDKDRIYLEPYTNEHGFVQLRCRKTKRPVAFVDDLNVSRSDDDVQIATCKIVIDPRVVDDNEKGNEGSIRVPPPPPRIRT